MVNTGSFDEVRRIVRSISLLTDLNSVITQASSAGVLVGTLSRTSRQTSINRPIFDAV